MRHDGRDRRAYYQAYYLANRDKLIKQNNDRARGNRWGEHFKARYGITREQYTQAVEDQGGLCLICGAAPDVLHVDHNHQTGEYRGLLCGPCNRHLGWYEKHSVNIHRYMNPQEGSS